MSDTARRPNRPIVPAAPVRFVPQFRQYLWGDRNLADWYYAPCEGPLAEAWLLSDLDPSPSLVDDGSGRTIRDLYPDRFPLLAKVLDAKLPLSVQVHPDDRHSLRTTGQAQGKSEAWFILDSQPESVIWAGLKPGVGPDELRRACVTGTVVDCLRPMSAIRGMIVHLPAGIVHALGAGVTAFEVQQTNDLTYRLYDWDRVDPRTGRPRDLHIEEAIACIDYAAVPAERSSHFDIQELSSTDAEFDDGRWRIVFGRYGKAEVSGADGSEILWPFHLLWLPPDSGRFRLNASKARVVVVSPP